jgi:hypothetical protein
MCLSAGIHVFMCWNSCVYRLKCMCLGAGKYVCVGWKIHVYIGWNACYFILVLMRIWLKLLYGFWLKLVERFRVEMYGFNLWILMKDFVCCTENLCRNSWVFSENLHVCLDWNSIEKLCAKLCILRHMNFWNKCSGECRPKMQLYWLWPLMSQVVRLG